MTWCTIFFVSDVIEQEFHHHADAGYIATDKLLPNGLVMHGLWVSFAEDCVLTCTVKPGCWRVKAMPYLVKPSEPHHPGDNCFIVEGWSWADGTRLTVMLFYGAITIGPLICAKICWLAEPKHELFDSAYQQNFVHLGGPIVMGVYYIMIIIKILKEPLWRIWLGCSPTGYTPSDNYGISTCNSNDVTHSAEGFSQAAILWKLTRQHRTNRRTQLLL